MTHRRLIVILLIGSLCLLAIPMTMAQPSFTTLYGVEVSTDTLWTIAKTSGQGQATGATGVDNLLGLACTQQVDALYAVDAPLGSNSRLYEVDVATGSATLIGDTGFDAVQGLAYDSTNQVLYAVTYLNELLTINPATGAATLIGQPGASFLDSLAYHQERNQLFAVDIDADTLYRIDPQTGAGQAVGGTGFGNVSGLAYDAQANVLYGAARSSGELITIDPNTGAGTPVGTLPNTAFNGLADCAPIFRIYLPVIVKSFPDDLITPVPTLIPTPTPVPTLIPTPIPTLPELNFDEESFPPQAVDAAEMELVPWEEIPGALTDAREAEIRDIILTNSDVQEALGDRFAHIYTDVREPENKMYPPDPTQPLPTRLIFFSHSNNQTVEVLALDNQVQEILTTPPSQYQPPEGVNEVLLAIDLARGVLGSQVDGLEGHAMVAHPPNVEGGAPLFFDRRILYAVFTDSETGFPRYFAHVDLTNLEVIESGPVPIE